MRTADFSFDLPPELIAQRPSVERGAERLLVLDRRTGERRHLHVPALPSLLDPGSLLVFNNSRVRNARLYGENEANGRKTEFLLLSGGGDRGAGIGGHQSSEGGGRQQESVVGCQGAVGDCAGGAAVWRVLCRGAGRKRGGGRFLFPENVFGNLAVDGGGLVLTFDRPVDDGYLDRWGHVPLPPYIKRPDEAIDAGRYQTVYAEKTGSVAAPTAGLHFTPEILAALAERGIETAFITLHIGLGTFLPVRVEQVEDHTMHKEYFYVDEAAAARIEKARSEGRKIIAAGTTAARTLETIWDGSRIACREGFSRIFIYGGSRFRLVDGLFTNFHTPCSTLLMLVSCFAGQFSNPDAGRRLILDTYAEAVTCRYRFFSYGDAMLIL
ncbi:MAG: tRNA preQ1(34) S-adenosylmethionine ribosyltransferase-isomerase QueA [Spirochaetaceae bacterium]|nr:tRNA preQ1(34) S-adenosylmethionine ribosyltransferase-isomerase QueA [Spirochaetaceae bacterium]